MVEADMNIVTDNEVAAFRSDGFVIAKRGLPSAVATGLCTAVEGVLRDNEDWHNLLRMPHIPKRNGVEEGVVGGDRIFRYAVHPVVLNVARAFCGPNLIMWGAEIFAKPPGVGKATPWHQDVYTPAVKPSEPTDRSSAISIWIAVDDVGVDNGCLRFIPRSGVGGAISHMHSDGTAALLNFSVDETAVDLSTAVDSILTPGQFSVHDSYVVHGANANTSGRRRAGISFHYMSAKDLYDRSYGSGKGSGLFRPAPMALRPIWLVLGENHNSGNDFEIGHEFLKDLDRLAEEARRLHSCALR